MVKRTSRHSRFAPGVGRILMSFACGGCALAPRPSASDAQAPDAWRDNIDTRQVDAQWRVGDSVTYEALVESGGRVTSRFFIKLIYQPQAEDLSDWPDDVANVTRASIDWHNGFVVDVWTRHVLIDLVRLDEKGNEVWRAPGSLGWIIVDPGLHDLMEKANQTRRDDTGRFDPDAREFYFVFGKLLAGVMSLNLSLQQTPEILETFREMIRPMLTWDLLWHVFKKVSLQMDAHALDAVERVTVGAEEFDTRVFSISIHLGQEKIGVARLKVAPPRPPLHLCGGLLEIRGESASHPDRGFTIRLHSIDRHLEGRPILMPLKIMEHVFKAS